MMSQEKFLQCVAASVSALVENARSLPFRRSCQILALSSVAGCSAWAASPAYSYQVVAKSGQAIGGLPLSNLTMPCLGNDGTLLFVGSTAAGQNGALFATNIVSGKPSLVAQQGAFLDGYTLGPIFGPTCSDKGANYFGTTLSSGNAIFSPSGYVELPGEKVSGYSVIPQSFSMNSNGEVVFSGTFDGGYSGIFAYDLELAGPGFTIGGVSLTSVASPSIDTQGAIAFNGTYTSGSASRTGIFTIDNQLVPTGNNLVVSTGNTVGGFTLLGLSAPSISKLGVIGYAGLYQPAHIAENETAYYIDHSVIAQSGETLDGLTIQTGEEITLSAIHGISLNAGGEALFLSHSLNVNGIGAFGAFTAKHSVVAAGDTVAGISVQTVDLASMNDAGQIAVTVSYSGGTAVIVATPKNGAPLPNNTTYKLQDGFGNIVDLGYALNPGWGDGPYAYLYSFNSSTTQQVVFTSAGKLRSVTNPNMYLYNDGGYLALGPNGDTFTIDQAIGAFTIKDGSVYLQSPGRISPPNKIAFSASPAYWSLINASPVDATP